MIFIFKKNKKNKNKAEVNEELSLIKLCENDSFEIISFNFEKSELIKILSLGISLNEKGKVLKFSPLKNVYLFEIRGSCVALSRELAAKIIVKKVISVKV